MNKSRFFLIMLFVSVLQTLCIQTQTNADLNVKMNKNELMIIVTSLEINDKALNMTYEIRNKTEEDAWIFVGRYPDFSLSHMCGGVYWDENSRTLMFGLRVNVQSPFSLPEPFYGKFIRLGSGQSQTESIYVKIPVNSAPWSESVDQQDQYYQYTTKLAIEYSYYSGNLPEMILRMAEEREKNRPIDSPDVNLSYYFSSQNEILSSREDELLIRWGKPDPRIAREKVLKTVVENIRIPYKEMSEYQLEYERPKLASCTKVEITYHPSVLEYFFPFAFQKNLLSPEELEYLKSQKSLVLKDTPKIMTFAYDVGNALSEHTIANTLSSRYRSCVDVICHYDNKPQTSFSIYNDDIKIDDGLISCREGFPSLKIVTPRIQAIDLRMQCASNLKNLWYRFCTHHFYKAQRQKDPSLKKRMLYPKPSQWCDDILRFYPAWDISGETKEMHICPSAGDGKCHYAMNPNCEPNSPGDMVLLFETTSGWNQHGGPELFTFDNHDPKGGCVLLNDGTVKFIRTKEELNTLKWK